MEEKKTTGFLIANLELAMSLTQPHLPHSHHLLWSSPLPYPLGIAFPWIL